MGDMIFRPLIEDMKWSYSRIKCFEDCPYRFFLKYIHTPPIRDDDKFYASYGSFMHSIIERFYKNELKKEAMVSEFLSRFQTDVKGERPAASIVNKYINAGIEYLKSFNQFPFNMLAVEERLDFEIDGIKMVGIIDYIGELDGELYIVDNKSRDMKPRSSRKKPTLKDKELDEMLKQLYLYSYAVKQKYGKFPKELCFNCFRTNTFISEPFVEQAYIETINWAKEKIEEIKNEEDFLPNIEYFCCTYICGINKECEYDEVVNRKRGRT